MRQQEDTLKNDGNKSYIYFFTEKFGICLKLFDNAGQTNPLWK